MTNRITPWMTSDEAASYAKVSIATIILARRSGGLRGYKVQGTKLWRFNVDDIDRWLTSGGAV